jgi:hypothetical protein
MRSSQRLAEPDLSLFVDIERVVDFDMNKWYIFGVQLILNDKLEPLDIVYVMIRSVRLRTKRNLGRFLLILAQVSLVSRRRVVATLAMPY